jgi:hypothetical protein
MSTENLNLQGCCYLSRHQLQIGTKVHLQLAEGEASSPIVNARVRSVRTPNNGGGLYQTGVEFDMLPRAWLWILEEAMAVPVPMPPRSAEPQAGATAPARVDALIAVLQGKLEDTAEKAVKIAIETQLEDAVKQALCKINEIRVANERQEEALAKQRLLLEQSFCSTASLSSGQNWLVCRLDSPVGLMMENIYTATQATARRFFVSAFLTASWNDWSA